MIVVIGSVACRLDPDGAGRAVGTAPAVAAAAAAAGAAVELLARVGEDGAGDELLLALARSGVGHLAVLRDPARPTALAPGLPDAPGAEDESLLPGLLAEAELAAMRPPRPRAPAGFDPPALEPADLSLGLRYLREFRVVVTVEPIAEGGAAVIAEAASFLDAALVVVAPAGIPVPEAYATATLLEPPAEDAEGAFASLVGRYAAALDRGEDPGDAFRSVAGDGGWQVAAG